MKKSRSERLQPVVAHASRLEQEAARVFAEAQRRVADSEQQLEQLQAFRDEYIASTPASTGSVTRLLDYQAFISKLNQGIIQAKSAIETTQRQREVMRQQWIKRRTRHQALLTVMEKYQQQEHRQEEQREQISLEEFSRQRLYLQN